MKILRPTAIIIATGAILFSCGNADRSNAKEISTNMEQMEVSKLKDEPIDKEFYIADSSFAPQKISGDKKKGRTTNHKKSPSKN